MNRNFFFILLISFRLSRGAKILAIFPYQGKSHNIMFEPLSSGLAKAGHSVDLVSHFPPDEHVPGLNHISLKGTLHFYVNNMTATKALSMKSFVGVMNFISRDEPRDLCNLMRLPQLQNILNTTEKYDVMITEIFGTNCYLGFAHKLKLPVIGVISSAMYAWAYGPFFDTSNPSYIPSQLTEFGHRMNFFERVSNLMTHLGSVILFHYYDRTVSEPIVKKYIDDLPPLNDLYNDMSLVLVNSHTSIHGARLKSPAVIDVAGLHINETVDLPEDLESWMNSAKNGVIYFSLGTMIKPETIGSEKISAICECFAELEDYKVLWKGKMEEMPAGLPPNVKMIQWIPQYAVLRHPKVKVFVTHGGLMGTLEAIHAGVAIIGIPFFADQYFNIASYVDRGFAVKVNYENLDKSTLSNALTSVLTDPKYERNIRHYSKLFKDRPLSPMQEAIYWVNFIIRNGGNSLKPPVSHLYWFQYYMIDVILYLTIITILSLLAIFVIFRKLIRLSCLKNSPANKIKTS
ncbi:UDP-glucosyltransferase 2-like [Athalia rosae]|uniref:UDP-glucosyltransferase 2-like n=1 Tax=Athalia rosae TaxID=37344 RepID=UPI0020336E52|nr:UDP-glucosyltransferase 2-like [Athalia rosae]